jgi:hypothetical protein
MSLVTARKEGQFIYLISDTHLTDSDVLPNESRPDRPQMVSDPRDSAIKITLLQPQIAVAFAGGSAFADDAIQQCRNRPLADVARILLQSNIDATNKVEYIIAVGAPIFDLIAIKDGKIAYGQQNAWIGDSDAFNFYQEKLSEIKEQDINHIHENLYYCQQALKAVIESSKFPTINGIQITVDNKSGQFAYQQIISTEILPYTFSGTGPQSIIIGHGSPQDGGYTVNICPDPRLPDILPVHILQGNIGIIYKSKNNGLLHPEILPDTDDIEFAEILLQRFGIPIRYRISAPIKSYFNRGIKALQKGDTSTAIAFFTKGLQEPGPELKSLLHLNLSSALYFSGQTASAFQHAQEAIRLDPKTYDQWLNIVSKGQHS